MLDMSPGKQLNVQPGQEPTPFLRKRVRVIRLLIAEDDRALGTFLRRGLEADGYQVHLTCDGGSAIIAFRQELPDLTILDLNMPVKDGEQVLNDARSLDADLPILVLTARQEVATRVRCLDHGADDLMLKPFSLFELRARCRALLRRKRDTRLLLHTGDFVLNRLDHTVCVAGEPVELTNKEFALLEQLMLNRGHCVSRPELLDSVWKLDSTQTTNIVDVYVNYLRRKLRDPLPGKLIRTVRGKGYVIPNDESAVVGPPATDGLPVDQLSEASVPNSSIQDETQLFELQGA